MTNLLILSVSKRFQHYDIPRVLSRRYSRTGKKNTLSGHKSYEKKGVRNIEGTMGSQDGLLSAARIHPWVFFAEVEPRGYLATSLIIDGVFVTTTVIGECLLASLRH